MTQPVVTELYFSTKSSVVYDPCEVEINSVGFRQTHDGVGFWFG